MLHRVDSRTIAAPCPGDSLKVYGLGYGEHGAGWWCICSAKRTCAHLAALKLVTLEPIGGVERVRPQLRADTRIADFMQPSNETQRSGAP
jgi:hypothetical protein